MTNKGLSEDKFSELRRRAQVYLTGQSSDEPEVAVEDVRRLVHELNTYQVELELQNEDLRQAQEELELARQKYADLYEFAPVAYLTVTARGLIDEANLTAAEMLGVERRGLLGQPFSVFILPADQDIFYSHRQKLLETKNKQTCELRLQKQDGTIFHAQMGTVIRAEIDGQGGQFRAMLTDISPLKWAEEKLQEYSQSLESEVRQRTAELEEEKRKVEAASRAKSEFLAVMSHELRTPLNAILGFTFILRQAAGDFFTDDQQGYLAEIEKSGHHLLAMIQEMLDIARLERDTEPVGCQAFDLDKQLAQCVLACQEKYANMAMEVAFAKDKPVGIICADKDKILQVVENLLGNAFKFTPDGSLVALSAACKKEGAATWLQIAVTDNGVGIDAKDFARIFLPFEQVDSSSTREFGGVGMGLYKAKKIAELLGGRLELTSSLGQGSTFTFFLPVGVGYDCQGAPPR